ncbi:hypothetical protein JMJ77_0003070 [Colletotrichum scovillei]|uniref:Uncharacterized protein n=1 Tax=Colletotrichum scovillei TaxID=1209932 RepID=A0A9P7QVB9_9PEZI|nr:hypothetical protein JMJ78_0006280 [Colletotrichum scovillei]KAG7043364.1 hypothetical protein JMJ77_0003070 [Colletotrichum scovillei]KAG7062812.1 hypothetical protein JMJ76_0009655 [Colletotrichum scovillei]
MLCRLSIILPSEMITMDWLVTSVAVMICYRKAGAVAMEVHVLAYFAYSPMPVRSSGFYCCLPIGGHRQPERQSGKTESHAAQ